MQIPFSRFTDIVLHIFVKYFTKFMLFIKICQNLSHFVEKKQYNHAIFQDKLKNFLKIVAHLLKLC